MLYFYQTNKHHIYAATLWSIYFVPLHYKMSPVKRICVFEHSWQILTAHALPVRGARDLAFCLKVPLDSLLVWASSEGSGETAWMRRLAWTFAARIGDKYQIRLTRSKWRMIMMNGGWLYRSVEKPCSEWSEVRASTYHVRSEVVPKSSCTGKNEYICGLICEKGMVNLYLKEGCM